MIGVALVFGSSGDILLKIREDAMFQDDEKEHLFQMGAGLFLIEHILIIYQFVTFWKSFRLSSVIPYVVVLLLLYEVILPSIPQSLTTMVILYSLTLTTSCFLSINALDPYRALKHEKFNVLATMLFLFSDCLVISKEIKGNTNDIGLMAMIKGIDEVVLEIVIMVTYYAAQMLFANGAYNRYRYSRAMTKRKYSD